MSIERWKNEIVARADSIQSSANIHKDSKRQADTAISIGKAKLVAIEDLGYVNGPNTPVLQLVWRSEKRNSRGYWAFYSEYIPARLNGRLEQIWFELLRDAVSHRRAIRSNDNARAEK